MPAKGLVAFWLKHFRFSLSGGNALSLCFSAIPDAKPLRTFAGIALALVAAAGLQARQARAESAVPDEADFLTACKAFGVGYIAIPGTQGCLSINGYVWYEIGASNDRGGFSAGFSQDHNYYPRGGFVNDSRAAVTFDLRTPTEWGAAQGQIRLLDEFSPELPWAAPASGGTRLGVDQAWLRIGGFLAGYTESAWTATQASWISSWGSHSWNGLWYGYQQRQLVQYSFGSDKALFGTVSLEASPDTVSYVPDIVAIFGYQHSWGAVWGKFGYDRSIGVHGPSGYAVSFGTQIEMKSPGSSFRLIGFYADSDNAYSTGGPYHGSGAGGVGNGSAKWSLLASYRWQVNPALALTAGAQYFSDFYRALSSEETGLDGYSLEATAVWNPLSDLEIRSELEYDKVDGLNGAIGGFLRFTRFF